jgi:uncharacterized protein YidB (DUF937 family)
MGLLDELAGTLMGKLTDGGGSQSQLADIALKMLGNNESGGLGGLLKTFSENGLAKTVESWVSTGGNLPVSSDEIISALGSEKVREIAGQIGISPEEAAQGLSKILPDLVSHLTPDGSMPDNESLAAALEALRNKL